jgi:hypothetical protein
MDEQKDWMEQKTFLWMYVYVDCVTGPFLHAFHNATIAKVPEESIS